MSVEYQIKRARRKTAAIHVTPNGVEVRVPYGVDEGWVDRFVASKLTWISKQQQKLAAHYADQPKLAIGESILYLGKPKKLTYEQGQKPLVRLDGEQLTLVGLHQPDQGIIQRQLEGWFKEQAKAYIPQITYARAQQLGVMDKLNQIRFRRTKTKWGHCTSAGNLQFNWQIMGAPVDVVDYLICHEVSHLLEHNHSKRFWAHVGSLCPQFQHHRLWLKQQGHKLIWC